MDEVTGCICRVCRTVQKSERWSATEKSERGDGCYGGWTVRKLESRGGEREMGGEEEASRDADSPIGRANAGKREKGGERGVG